MIKKFYIGQRKLLTWTVLSLFGFLSFLIIHILPNSASAIDPMVSLLPSLERVGRTENIKGSKAINLFAARGESESFQVVVTAPRKGMTNVKVSVSDLRSASGKSISKKNITLYREHYVYVQQPSPYFSGHTNITLGKGWYADGLIPFIDPNTQSPPATAPLRAVPFDVASSNNQPIWVDVFVPINTAPGQYTGKVSITSNQGKQEVKVALRVGKFALPLKPSLDSSFAFWAAKSRANNVELLKHKLMPRTVALGDEKYLQSQWGLISTDLGFWSGANVTTCRMNPVPSVQELKKKASQHVAGLKVYNYTADEIDRCPNLDQPLKQWADNLHQAGVKNLVTMKPKPGLYLNSSQGKSVVDIWVLSPKMYDAALAQVAQVIKKGDRVWSYNTLVQDDSSPKWEIDFQPINFRIQPGFINQSLGITGLLYWRIDQWTKDPWHDIQTFKNEENYHFPGEGMLVYPGQQVGVSGVVPSMRLKWLRDGVEDYEYIEILKKLGRGNWALQVSRSVGRDWTNWNRNPGAIESARMTLAREIERLYAQQKNSG